MAASAKVPPAVASEEIATRSATEFGAGCTSCRKRRIRSADCVSTNEITCLIVDDHEVVREGLRLSLSRAPHIRVIGEAADGESAVALAERRRPNVIIMDVRMPGMDGLEATKILTEKVPDSAVLIFTAYSERSLLSRGLESGAKGYILKEAPHATLLRAIEKVAGGEGYVDPALMPAFLTGKDKDDMLTGREREILQLLADGMSNADVAAKLFISQETVKSHVRHILAKLEADTRTHAVAIALREAIIDSLSDEPSPRDLTEQVLAAEQDERRRIALFLHDGPVQSLAGVALMLDAALDFMLRGKTDQAGEVLEKAMSRTRLTIGELRDLSFNLEPVVLRDHGLAMAVNALAQDRGIEHGIEVQIDVAAAESLGERSQAALYQIVREAFEGAIRRGPPKNFSVRVVSTGDGGLEATI